MGNYTVLTLAVGWMGAVFLAGLQLIVLRQLWKGDLSRLLCDESSHASLSRFQFLIFTFVIAGSLLVVVLGGSDKPSFPAEIPTGIFGLLGISAGSYAISKGIHNSNPPKP